MIRVAILILTPAIFASLGMLAGWWCDNRPILGALIAAIAGLGVAIVTVTDEGFRRRRP